MADGQRSARILALVAEQAARRGSRVDVIDVCTAAVSILPVGGAGISAMSRTRDSSPLCSTDGISERLEELQLALGEGPCVDAFALGEAVLAPDLRVGEVRDHWPVFASAAVEAGAGAVFAIPLRIGAISPGVLDLYAVAPGGLSAGELADAMTFADAAALVLLDGAQGELGGYRAEIDQATGILTEQLGVGVEEAFVRLRAHTYAEGRRLAEVAADVVAHRLRLPLAPDPD
ncbi:ANTAR domain-containing protein [Streptomyces beijiangensis]